MPECDLNAKVNLDSLLLAEGHGTGSQGQATFLARSCQGGADSNAIYTVWITYRGYIIKAAPEHLRLANDKEQLSLSGWIDGITKTKDEIEQQPRYIDLTLEETLNLEEQQQALPDEKAPLLRLRQKTAAEKVIRRYTPNEWRYNPATGELIRIHYHLRKIKFKPTE